MFKPMPILDTSEYRAIDHTLVHASSKTTPPASLVFDEADVSKAALYGRALYELAGVAFSAPRGLKWESNWHRYYQWNIPQRLKWIRYIERKATKENPLPMAKELFLKAMVIRMTGK